MLVDRDMNPISVPLVLAKTLLEVGLGTAAAFSFARTGKAPRWSGLGPGK
jgi:hypothetical protein